MKTLEFSKDVIDKEVEQRLLNIMKEHPTKMIQYLLLLTGRECVRANATELTCSCEADVEDKRYKITNNITIEQI